MENQAVRTGRRYRRDRAARNIAWTGLLVGTMLCISGVWWLAQPLDTANTRQADATLFMLNSTPSRDVSHPAPAPQAMPTVTFITRPVQVNTTPQPSLSEQPAAEPTGPTFNGRPIRPVRTLSMLVTAYSPDHRSCGKHADNITASGYSVWTNGMKLVAADKRILRFGSIVTVPGYNRGRPVPVLDRGGKIKGHRLDVLYPTHQVARKWGARRLQVTVWDYAD